MNSEDEPVCERSCEPVDLMAILEPLEAYLNLGEISRLRTLNHKFYTETDAFIGWKQRSNALGLRRKKTYSRESVVGHIHKTNSRCCECGGRNARRYGLLDRKFRVCHDCAYENNGYRQIVRRQDIARCFGFTPYKTVKFARQLRPVHGGNGLHPYLYWGAEVNRASRVGFG